MIYAYLFEAKSVQAYILDSGRLRDLVGASEQVDQLCGDLDGKLDERMLLDQVVKAAGLVALDPFDGIDDQRIGERIVFSRKAGGAFFAFSGSADSIDRLALLWPLAVRQFAPGLDFDQGRGVGATALAAFDAARGETVDVDTPAGHDLRSARSRPLVQLPEAGPLVHRSQRTGRPAVDLEASPEGALELVDATTIRQRRFRNPTEPSRRRGTLIERFRPPELQLTWDNWPIDLEPGDTTVFPFIDDNRTVAVVHADGNGIGQLLQKLLQHISDHAQARFIELLSLFSTELDRITREAVQSAVREVLWPNRDANDILPARPIVLGGDDLTLIVRGDLALAFTACFLRAFEHASLGLIAKLKKTRRADNQTTDLALPFDRLTACAGIAYIKAGQPFYLANRLAEGIAGAVKQRAKAMVADTPQRMPASSLGFHRITTAVIDDYPRILERELSTSGTSPDQPRRWRHTLGAYAVGDGAAALPQLRDLIELQRLLEEPAMARGPARELLTLLGQSEAEARVRYQRWRRVLGDGQPDAGREFDERLSTLLATPSQDLALPYRQAMTADDSAATTPTREGPLADLHALLSVRSRTDLFGNEEPQQ